MHSSALPFSSFASTSSVPNRQCTAWSANIDPSTTTRVPPWMRPPCGTTALTCTSGCSKKTKSASERRYCCPFSETRAHSCCPSAGTVDSSRGPVNGGVRHRIRLELTSVAFVTAAREPNRHSSVPWSRKSTPLTSSRLPPAIGPATGSVAVTSALVVFSYRKTTDDGMNAYRSSFSVSSTVATSPSMLAAGLRHSSSVGDSSVAGTTPPSAGTSTPTSPPNRQNTPPRSAKPEPVTVTFVPPSAGPPRGKTPVTATPAAS